MNETQEKAENRDSDNPVVKIFQILNSHLNALQSIDVKTQQLGQTIDDLEECFKEQDQINQSMRERRFN